MLASDPYLEFGLDPSAKRIVTFLRDEPTVKMALPVEQDGARLLALAGGSSSVPICRPPRGRCS